MKCSILILLEIIKKNYNHATRKFKIIECIKIKIISNIIENSNESNDNNESSENTFLDELLLAADKNHND